MSSSLARIWKKIKWTNLNFKYSAHLEPITRSKWQKQNLEDQNNNGPNLKSRFHTFSTENLDFNMRI